MIWGYPYFRKPPNSNRWKKHKDDKRRSNRSARDWNAQPGAAVKMAIQLVCILKEESLLQCFTMDISLPVLGHILVCTASFLQPVEGAGTAQVSFGARCGCPLVATDGLR